MPEAFSVTTSANVGVSSRIPVFVITGFLGSGKTTLLNRLIHHPSMANSAIIVNEFGAIALDQHLIEAGEQEVAVLSNGCLCCGMQEDLESTLGTLFHTRSAHGSEGFDRLLIETTGLADPAPIVQSVIGNPMISANFELGAVVTTVDAAHIVRQLRESSEAVKQVALADKLVVTKTDLAAAGDVDAILGVLDGVNPGAQMFQVVQGEIAPSTLFGMAEGDFTSRWTTEAASGLARADHAHHDHQAKSDHLTGISTFSFAWDVQLSWREFSRWLTPLRIRHADQLLRVKGILNLLGERQPLVIHGVHHVFHPPVPFQGRYPDHLSRLVFITRGLNRDEVEADWLRFSERL